MSVRSDVLLWAQRILAKADASAHQLLEVRPDAPPDVISAAFQRVARMAHPDLHRSGLDAADFEMVTSAYSRVAGAYQEMRSRRPGTQAKPPGKDEPQSLISQRMSSQIKAQTPSAGLPVAGAPSSGASAQSMNSKALVYYRKAELALRRGELRPAVMQIKMAIAADPASTFLRSALGEIEKELANKP